jgi:hypothetical protein
MAFEGEMGGGFALALAWIRLNRGGLGRFGWSVLNFPSKGLGTKENTPQNHPWMGP